MSTNNLVLVSHFCQHHQVEMSFIDSLQSYGLIAIQVIQEDKYVHIDDINEIEKMIKFYYDLGINLEGIDVVFNLLLQNEALRRELDIAHQKLKVLDTTSE